MKTDSTSSQAEQFNLEASLIAHKEELESYIEVEANNKADIVRGFFEQLENPQQVNQSAFPSLVMSGVAGSFAIAYSQYLEVPPSFLYMSFLTVLGNIISGKVTLRSEILPQTRLFLVLLGRSADERKSTAISKTVDFFRSAMADGGVNICYGVGSAEGLAKELEASSRLILTIDELKTFVQKAKIEGSVLLPCVNSLYEQNHFHSRTKNHSVSLENAHLSLLAASTLETYSVMFSSAFLDIGFVNRLFIVLDKGQKRFAIPRMIPQQAKDAVATKLRESLVIAEHLGQQQSPYPMPIMPEAERLFEEWYFSTPQSVFTKRLDTYGLRLMPLLAVNDRKKAVDVETVEKVVALLDYQLAVRREADPVDADSKVAALEERIRRILSNGPLSKRELERKINKGRCGIWAWNSAIGNLRKAGDVLWDKKTGRFEGCSNE